MTNDEQRKPGTFNDGDTPLADVAQFQSEEANDTIEKNTLIDRLLQSKQITLQYARLLRSIQTSTLGKEHATLRKIQAVLALKDILKEENIAQKTTVYIGSNIDWQFPAALGARNITLMDPEINTPEQRLKLLTSTREFDEKAFFQIDNPSHLTFNLDLGEGVEQIDLQINTDEVATHQSTNQIGCVIEFAGPSKGYNRSRAPLIPNIAQTMASDGLILNFDYSHNPLYTPEIGLDFIERGEFYMYKVRNKTSLISASKIDYLPPSPSLDTLRTIHKSHG